jgi:hypothetical protein
VITSVILLTACNDADKGLTNSSTSSSTSNSTSNSTSKSTSKSTSNSISKSSVIQTEQKSTQNFSEYETYFGAINSELKDDIKPIYFGLTDVDFDEEYEIFCIKENGSQGYKNCYIYKIVNNSPRFLAEFSGFSRDGETLFYEFEDNFYIYSKEKHSNQRKSIVISALQNREIKNYLTCYYDSTKNNGDFDKVSAYHFEKNISETEFNRLLNEFNNSSSKITSIYFGEVIC